MDISIIIVNYKSRGLALNCLKSIKEADWDALKYEIIVVDNNSVDSLGEILAWQNPEIKFIQSNKNLGMGAGNNLGLRGAQGKYLVVMNPDTIAFKDTFKILYDYLEANPRVGLAGPKQFYPDKTVQDTCFRWYGPLTPIFRRLPLECLPFVKKDLDRFLMKDYNKEEARPVDWLLGSFLFCRAKALEQVGLFDERFFLYFEDTELCRRFWQKGWQVIYYPAAQIIHNLQRQSAKTAWYKFFTSKATVYHIVSWLKYLRKWGISN
ncbi:hypothetical protein CO116_00465 [Candidatus Falkowbacteria bacterium CG_4_9_14_3_um_filter_38_19]|uniref:Glycosyltransferase 2-like domain-containing protein n=2 Tax=Candidatus Falkowiibacteriota TaxID=1752728 RepID=A0A2M6WSA1_9BACT|nr:glycosyltransferase family 2 protein [Candidatus Parcubacteria bacterium]PIT95576.1 MAG: hypothetical protein COT96_00490 [Candidatus Falkowbacteria bacterium CG10_big_fil_rev_8_21_14_0_10_38_22]PJB17871.1 MAG: hypothetical protein CO116_00465 [Candidatus Falkowbacteria bacterium CG_4_9_14_3_um_filter_38_19]